MKYLVTGATGGLGRNLAERLCREGHNVVGMGRREVPGHALSAQGMRFVRADIKDAAALADAMRGADAVLHCAALSSPWGRYQDFYAANVTGTENVICAMKNTGVPLLIHVSTPSIYFDFKDRLGIREKDPLPRRFVNAYAATKKLAEEKVMAACAKGEIKATILRPRAIIGPYDGVLLPRLLRATQRGFMPLLNGGKALLDITCVENVVDAMVLALEPGKHQQGRIYNITNGESVTLAHLISGMLKSLRMDIPVKHVPYALMRTAAACMEGASLLLPGRPEPPLTQYGIGVLSFSQTLDISAAQNDLGYAPRVPLMRGIQQAADWWRQHAHQV